MIDHHALSSSYSTCGDPFLLRQDTDEEEVAAKAEEERQQRLEAEAEAAALKVCPGSNFRANFC